MAKPRWGEKATWLLMVILKFGTLSLPQMVKRNLVYFFWQLGIYDFHSDCLERCCKSLKSSCLKDFDNNSSHKVGHVRSLKRTMMWLYESVKSSWCCACKYWGCCTDAPSCSRDHQQVSYMFLFVGYYFLYPSFCNVALCQGPRVVDMHWSFCWGMGVGSIVKSDIPFCPFRPHLTNLKIYLSKIHKISNWSVGFKSSLPTSQWVCRTADKLQLGEISYHFNHLQSLNISWTHWIRELDHQKPSIFRSDVPKSESLRYAR